MAEILALGRQHYPPLCGRRADAYPAAPAADPNLPVSLPRAAGGPRHAAEWATTRASAPRPGTARTCRRADEDPRRAGCVQSRLRVIWGDDQYENSRRTCPPYCVSAYETFKITVPGNVWANPPKLFETPGHVRGAKRLTPGLIEFWLRCGLRLQALHHRPGHAFANACSISLQRVGFPYRSFRWRSKNCLRAQGHQPASGFPNFEAL